LNFFQTEYKNIYIYNTRSDIVMTAYTRRQYGRGEKEGCAIHNITYSLYITLILYNIYLYIHTHTYIYKFVFVFYVVWLKGMV